MKHVIEIKDGINEDIKNQINLIINLFYDIQKINKETVRMSLETFDILKERKKKFFFLYEK